MPFVLTLGLLLALVPLAAGAPRPRVIAHRGVAREAPEKAVALGVDYIQTDHPRELLAMLRGARAAGDPPGPLLGGCQGRLPTRPCGSAARSSISW